MKNQPGNSSMTFSLVGAGRVGTVLAYHFNQLGFKPVWVWNRSKDGITRALRWVPFSETSTSSFPPVRGVDLIVISVTDDALNTVIARMEKQYVNTENACFVHVSGVYSSSILSGLERKGGATGSMHPCGTFPSVKLGIKSIGKTPLVCEGKNCDELFNLLSEKRGNLYIIPPEMKSLYHVSTVFASNYMMILLDSVKDLAGETGLGKNWVSIYDHLIKTSMQNVYDSDIDTVLTGPIMRGDVETVRTHIRILQKYPYTKGIYCLLGIGAVEVALNNRTITKQTGAEIVRILREE